MPDATIYAIYKIKMQISKIKIKNQKTKIKSNIILIAGGSDKKLDYSEFAKTIKKHCSYAIVYKGAATDTASDKIVEEFKKMQITNFVVKNSLNNCERFAANMARKGDIILFSPAASSFGKFKHEFDRGEKFKRAVESIKRKARALEIL